MKVKDIVIIWLLVILIAGIFAGVKASESANYYSIGTDAYNNYYAAPGRGRMPASQDDANWKDYFYANGDYYGTIDIGIYRFSFVGGNPHIIDNYYFTWGYRIYYGLTDNFQHYQLINQSWEERCLLTGKIDNPTYVGGIQFKGQGFTSPHLNYNTKYYFWVEPIILSRLDAGKIDPSYHMTWLQEIQEYGEPDYSYYRHYAIVYPLVLLHGYVTTKGTPPSPPGGCVLKNTNILTPFGYRKVQNIKVGTIVNTYDAEYNKLSLGLVLRNEKTIVGTVENIRWEGGELWVTTYDQPIYIRNHTYQGWLKDPIHLKPGWQMYNPVYHCWINITQIKIYSGRFAVYDLQVEPYENYIANGILLKDKPIPR